MSPPMLYEMSLGAFNCRRLLLVTRPRSRREERSPCGAGKPRGRKTAVFTGPVTEGRTVNRNGPPCPGRAPQSETAWDELRSGRRALSSYSGFRRFRPEHSLPGSAVNGSRETSAKPRGEPLGQSACSRAPLYAAGSLLGAFPHQLLKCHLVASLERYPKCRYADYFQFHGLNHSVFP